MKQQRVLVCEDTLEGILSAVHYAYMSRYGHDYTSIAIEGYLEQKMFTDYIQIDTDLDKAERVAQSIIRKISPQAYQWVEQAAMSCHKDEKGDAIYRFLILGYAMGVASLGYLSNDAVLTVYKLAREVSRETQRLRGFVRFGQLDNGVMFAKLDPKHNQLIFLGRFFEERFPQMHWMIYDETRHLVCVHEAGKAFYMMCNQQMEGEITQHYSTEETKFLAWWQTFVDTIAIKERHNPRCQMQMMPKMYWKNMPEHEKNL